MREEASVTVGRFSFSFRPQYNGGGTTGSYEIRAEVFQDKVLLRPVRWLERPYGYIMVGAAMQFTGADRLTGHITDNSCGRIELIRQSSFAPPGIW